MSASVRAETLQISESRIGEGIHGVLHSHILDCEVFFLTNLQIRKWFSICVRAWAEYTICIIICCWYVCSGLDIT